MIRTILSIAGKPGLYRLVSQGRNMLIVESLSTGKRMPAHARDKVMSLGDIAMYTTGDDKPLAEILELLKAKTNGQKVEAAVIKDDAAARNLFGEVLPEFDRDRVHDSDIRKLYQWYNALLDAGIDSFVQPQEGEQADNTQAEA